MVLLATSWTRLLRAPRILVYSQVQIFGGHLHDELTDVFHDWWTPWPAPQAPVVFLAISRRCKFSGVPGVTTVPVSPRALRPTTLAFAARRRRYAFVKRSRRGGKVFTKDVILCLEIIDDVPLLLVDPAGDGDDKELQRLRTLTHTS